MSWRRRLVLAPVLVLVLAPVLVLRLRFGPACAGAAVKRASEGVGCHNRCGGLTPRPSGTAKARYG